MTALRSRRSRSMRAGSPVSTGAPGGGWTASTVRLPNLGQIYLTDCTAARRPRGPRGRCSGRPTLTAYSRGMFLGAVVRPRETLRREAAAPSLVRGAATVVGSGVVCLALEVTGAVLGTGGTAALALSLAAPLLLVAFWLASALLVGAGARLMGWPPSRSELLAVTGLTFPVLTLYALIALLQSAGPRVGGGTVATVAGLFALPVIAWFVVLNAIAVG